MSFLSTSLMIALRGASGAGGRGVWVVIAAGVMAAAAPLAWADPGPGADSPALRSLGHLSAETQAAVVIPELARTNGVLADLRQRYDLPMPAMNDLVAAFTREAGMYGLDDSRPVLIAFEGVDRAMVGQGEPGVFVLVPVRDYTVFVEGYAGDPEAEVTPLHLARHHGYARQLGDFALLGHSAESVAGYRPLDDADGVAQRIGSYGRRYLTDAAAALYVDVAKLATALEAARDELADEAASGGAAPGPMVWVEPTLAMLEGIDAAMLTLETDEKGMALTQALTYRSADAPLARLLAGPGRDLGEELARLPEQAFLFTGAVDLEVLRLEGWVDRWVEAARAEGDAAAETVLEGMRPLMAQARTMATAYYVPTRQLLMSGNLMNQVTIMQVDDPGQYRADLRAYVEGLDGLALAVNEQGREDPNTPAPAPAPGSMQAMAAQFSSRYISNALHISGVEVDQYQIRLPAALQDEAAQLGPAAALLGVQQSTGYIATTEGHVLITTQPNPQLVSRAMDTIARGGGLGAATPQQLAQSQAEAERRPSGPEARRERPTRVGGPAYAQETPETQRQRAERERRAAARERDVDDAPDAPRTIGDLRELALPTGAVLEGYLSLAGIVRTIELVMPLGEAGGLTVPDDLPPLAVAVGVEQDGGGVAGRVYVPHGAARFVVDMGFHLGSMFSPMTVEDGPAVEWQERGR